MSPKGTKTGVWSGGAFSDAEISGGSGNLSVAVTPNTASWILKGPDTFGTDGVSSGTGDASFSDIPAGVYVFEPQGLAGYRTPPREFKVLANGEAVTFTAIWYDNQGDRLIHGRRFTERMMRDRCLIANVEIVEDGPQDKPTWEFSGLDEEKCTLVSNQGKQVFDGSGVTVSDAQLLVPIGTSVNGSSRIKVVSKFKRTLAIPELYAVLGDPSQETTAIMMNLRRITEASLL